MMMTMRMLQILGVSEDECQRPHDRNSVTDLIVHSSFKKHSHHDEKQSSDGDSHNPGKPVLSKARNEGQGRGEEDNETNGDVNPGRVENG